MNALISQSLKAFGLAVALAFATPPAGAADSDKDSPTTIDADKMTYDDLKQVNVFTGNVQLVRGSLIIRGDRLTIKQSPEGFQFGTAEGKPATFRQKRNGPGDRYVDGVAARIDYDGKTDTVVFQKSAVLRKLDGNTVTEEIRGDTITYLQRTEYFTVNNDGPTARDGANTTNPSGRVRAVIQPKPETPSEGKGKTGAGTSPAAKPDSGASLRLDSTVKAAP